MELPILIPVGKKNWALVDAQDYQKLNKRTWYVNGERSYAVSLARPEDNVKTKMVFMHQLVCPSGKGMITDHINRNTLDNRRSNLRSCPKSVDRQNMVKHKANPDRITSSQFKGVTFKKQIKRWTARISSNGKRINIGCY